MGFLRTFGLYQETKKQIIVSLNEINDWGSTKAYMKAISEELENDSDYHAAIIFLGRQFEEDTYLNIKSLLLQHGIPVQQIRENTLQQNDYQLQFTLQNLSISVYAKLGGIPWTVAQDNSYNDEIVIGMGTCEFSQSRIKSRQRYIGITTVFSGDGNYMLSSVSKECPYNDYPDTIKEETLRVLETIKQRNGWQKDDTIKLVFHCYKPLKKIEMAEIVEECIDRFKDDYHIQFAFLTITKDHSFKWSWTKNFYFRVYKECHV